MFQIPVLYFIHDLKHISPPQNLVFTVCTARITN